MSAQTTDTESQPTEERSSAELRTELELLREENERLRDAYATSQRATYRRTAMGLAAVGVLAAIAAIFLGGVRDVLIVLAAIGFFSAVLTWYLTPERVVTIGVSESVYDAITANADRIHDELGLQPTTIYVPVDESVRVFVPQHRDYQLPEDSTSVFQTDTPSRGVLWTPTGQSLVTELNRTQPHQETEAIPDVARQAGDAVVAQFEIADSVDIDADASDDRVVITVTGASFGALTRFDHPVISTIAVAVASHCDVPLEVDPVNETTVALKRSKTAESFNSS